MIRSKQQGFTLIELIMVIVILGILAATALPKFVDLSGDAEQAAVDGVAGAAASAMSINYAGCSIARHDSSSVKCVKIKKCDEVGTILQGGLDSDYTPAVDTGADIGTTNGGTAICKVSKTVGSTTYKATFTGTSAGN